MIKNKYTIVKTEIVKKTYLFNGVIDENHNKDFKLDQVRGTEVICTEYVAIQLPK